MTLLSKYININQIKVMFKFRLKVMIFIAIVGLALCFTTFNAVARNTIHTATNEYTNR